VTVCVLVTVETGAVEVEVTVDAGAVEVVTIVDLGAVDVNVVVGGVQGAAVASPAWPAGPPPPAITPAKRPAARTPASPAD
jgi:hypothetical protein